MSTRSVTLDEATPADAELLGNLLQLYIHDLSAIFSQVELGADGRFAYPKLGLYLEGTDGKRAFVIRDAGRVAGFALVKRGSPFSDDPELLDVAEFFVARRFRGSGVGRAAAEQLWDRLPSRWTVRAAQKNAEAVSFWRRTITAYTDGTAEEGARNDGAEPWVVFTFLSPRA
jgi:predicted acetyltransferase